MDWYFQNCNDNWEQQYGIKLDTLDNPGWSLDIDLVGTLLEGTELSQKVERSESDWIHVKSDGKVFRGRCGALNLEEMIHVFAAWKDGVVIDS
jgi:hypothetical protein